LRAPFSRHAFVARQKQGTAQYGIPPSPCGRMATKKFIPEFTGIKIFYFPFICDIIIIAQVLLIMKKILF
jgi:hypothetical protein